MQRLAGIDPRHHRDLLPAGGDRAAARQRLAALLAQATGAETAGLFADSREAEGERLFLAPDGEVARLDELDPAEGAALKAEIGRLLSELRRAAEAAGGDLPALVQAAREVPSLDCVFAHAGRPVLAGWGMAPRTHPAGLGLLAALDDGQAAERPVAQHWRLAGIAAGVLLLLGAASALAMPVLAPLLAPPAPACDIAPGQLDRLAELQRAQRDEQSLRNRLAEALRQAGQRRAECPLAQPAPAQVSPPALPAERWERRDLAVLEGCWNLDSDYTMWNTRTREAIRVRSWQMCFDGQGRGTQTLAFDNGITCRGDTQARFMGNNLIIDDLRHVPCDRGSQILHRVSTCERVGDDRAACLSREATPQGPGTDPGSRFTLRR